jgi:hypothetical protein
MRMFRRCSNSEPWFSNQHSRKSADAAKQRTHNVSLWYWSISFEEIRLDRLATGCLAPWVVTPSICSVQPADWQWRIHVKLEVEICMQGVAITIGQQLSHVLRVEAVPQGWREQAVLKRRRSTSSARAARRFFWPAQLAASTCHPRVGRPQIVSPSHP